MKKNLLLAFCILITLHSDAQILLAQYNFDNDATDAVGNHHGTPLNGPTYTTDRFGNPNSAISLDGIDDYVDFANGLTLQANTYTYDLWVNPYSNPGGGTAQCILSIGGTGGDQTMNNVNAAGIGWNCGGYVNPTGSYGIYSGVVPTLNQWYHVTSIRDAGSHTLYVNGVQVDFTAVGLANTPKYGQNFAWLGRRTYIGGAGPQYFHGAIDDLKIYSGVNIPLPLDLISFTGKRENISAFLNWEIANMKNVSHFEIEKCNDAKSYSKVGTIAVTEKSKYSFTDVKLFDRNNYYRLKIIDDDGKFSYSNTIFVLNSNKIDITLFPNPVTNELNLISSANDFTYEIYNIYGQKMLTGISLENHKTISCEAMNKGIYFIKVESASDIETLKFSKD